jgi:hypothetical protein
VPLCYWGGAAQIPEGGLKENASKPLLDLNSHMKKVKTRPLLFSREVSANSEKERF